MAALIVLATSLQAFSLRTPLPAPSTVANRAAVVATENVGRRQAAQLATAFAVTSVTLTPQAASAAYPGLSIKTTEGEMQFELWDDVAPKHVESFLKLAKQGFFDGGAFHRIIPGFVIQGGDPNVKVGYGPGGTLDGADKGAMKKWGTGGPGYNVKAEFNERLHEKGVLSMARTSAPISSLRPLAWSRPCCPPFALRAWLLTQRSSDRHCSPQVPAIPTRPVASSLCALAASRRSTTSTPSSAS